MNFKLMAWIVLPIAGLIAAGMVVWWLLSWVFGFVFYLVLGAVAVGAIMWGWSKMRGKVGGAPRRKEIP